MNAYPLCHSVFFYHLLLSFCLQFTYRKVRNLRIGVDKLVGKVSINLFRHVKSAACVIKYNNTEWLLIMNFQCQYEPQNYCYHQWWCYLPLQHYCHWNVACTNPGLHDSQSTELPCENERWSKFSSFLEFQNELTKIKAEKTQPLWVLTVKKPLKTIIVSKIRNSHLLMKTSFNIHTTAFDAFTLENPSLVDQ